MKKLCLCLLSSFLALSLAACQGSNACTCQECPCSTSSNQPVDATTVVESTTPSADASLKLPATEPTPPPAIELTDPECADLTNRQIIENTLAGAEYIKNGWAVTVQQDASGWIQFHMQNCPIKKLNPKYLYPVDAWTPESVAQSYLDGSAPWLKSTDSAAEKASLALDNCAAILWSRDYGYEFRLTDDGWLCINGCHTLPVNCQTYSSLEPMLMVERYQSGEWNGSRVYSEDYRTSVKLSSYDDYLEYFYTYCYTGYPEQVTDGLVYEFQSPALGPWWENEQQYDIQSYDESAYMMAYVKNVYPDLPGGKIAGSIDGTVTDSYYAIERRSDTGATSVVATSGPYYFAKGKLLQHWEIPVAYNGGAYLLDHIAYQENNHRYFYTGSQLLDLHDGGEYKIILSGILAHGGVESISWFYYLDDGMLKCAATGGGEDIYWHDIISDRIVTDVTGNYEIFVALEGDENIYALRHWYSDNTYLLDVLGPGTVQEYDNAWQEWEGTFDDFVTTCQVKNGLEPS